MSFTRARCDSSASASTGISLTFDFCSSEDDNDIFNDPEKPFENNQPMQFVNVNAAYHHILDPLKKSADIIGKLKKETLYKHQIIVNDDSKMSEMSSMSPMLSSDFAISTPMDHILNKSTINYCSADTRSYSTPISASPNYNYNYPYSSAFDQMPMYKVFSNYSTGDGQISRSPSMPAPALTPTLNSYSSTPHLKPMASMMNTMTTVPLMSNSIINQGSNSKPLLARNTIATLPSNSMNSNTQQTTSVIQTNNNLNTNQVITDIILEEVLEKSSASTTMENIDQGFIWGTYISDAKVSEDSSSDNEEVLSMMIRNRVCDFNDYYVPIENQEQLNNSLKINDGEYNKEVLHMIDSNKDIDIFETKLTADDSEISSDSSSFDSSTNCMKWGSINNSLVHHKKYFTDDKPTLNMKNILVHTKKSVFRHSERNLPLVKDRKQRNVDICIMSGLKPKQYDICLVMAAPLKIYGGSHHKQKRPAIKHHHRISIRHDNILQFCTLCYIVDQ